MLQIVVPENEIYDEKSSTFIPIKRQSLWLEHSLISISKWESKTKKSFLSTLNKMTAEEFIEYVRCMTVTPNVDSNAYYGLTEENVLAIRDYINDGMTATTFRSKDSRRSSKVVTSELIYYWMITYGIPLECEKWHFNRLMTLLRICSVENSSGKKMNRKQIYEQNRALNNARKKGLHSNG